MPRSCHSAASAALASGATQTPSRARTIHAVFLHDASDRDSTAFVHGACTRRLQRARDGAHARGNGAARSSARRSSTSCSKYSRRSCRASCASQSCGSCARRSHKRSACASTSARAASSSSTSLYQSKLSRSYSFHPSHVHILPPRSRSRQTDRCRSRLHLAVAHDDGDLHPAAPNDCASPSSRVRSSTDQNHTSTKCNWLLYGALYAKSHRGKRKVDMLVHVAI